jgi:hypothetical protein
MKTLKRFFHIVAFGLILTSCASHNPEMSKPFLHHVYELKQDMYVCQEQYRYHGYANVFDGSKDRFFMRDPHGFNVHCEDSMYTLAYRTKPAIWPQGHGDFEVREWLIAKLPRGTKFIINEYIVPNDYSEVPSEAYVTVASGKFSGLNAEWPWFDFIHEVDAPIYPFMGCPPPMVSCVPSPKRLCPSRCIVN